MMEFMWNLCAMTGEKEKSILKSLGNSSLIICLFSKHPHRKQGTAGG